MRERYRIRLSRIFEIPSTSDEKPSHCVKSVRIRSYSSPYFLAFRLNTETYSVSLLIQSECGIIATRITPSTDTFTQWVLWSKTLDLDWNITGFAIFMEYHCHNFRNTKYFTCSQIKQDNGWYSSWMIMDIRTL